ncbi:unnamed protein product (mitochondrion) [Plasmodiophora brassicae]|uniref:RGS domain-containing protein n=1 Tax=Plasmodiophora brassicae TaxID=37360 RepID=A0A3P3Y0X9_PLABS|nr:unnamed protein product [Plasmodiophora brassicae]
MASARLLLISRALFVAFAVFDLVLFPAVVIVPFLKRRHSEYIRCRQPWLVVLHYVGQCLIHLIMLYEVFAGVACPAHSSTLLYEIIIPFLVDGVTVRAYSLYWRTRLTRAKVLAVNKPPNKKASGIGRPNAISAPQGLLTQSDQWYLARPWIASDRTAMRLFLTCVVVHLVIATTDLVASSALGACITGVGFLLATCLTFVTLGFLFAISCRLRTCSDALHIKSSLVWQARLAACNVVMFFVVSVPQISDLYADAFPLLPAYMWLNARVSSVTELVVPLWLSYRGYSAVDQDIDKLLKHDEFRHAFTSFLEMEFCPEIMLFYDAMCAYKALFAATMRSRWAGKDKRTSSTVQSIDSDSVVSMEFGDLTSFSGDRSAEMGEAIYREFIAVGSANELNISGRLRARYDALFRKGGDHVLLHVAPGDAAPDAPRPGPALFDPVWSAMVLLIQNGKIQRFSSTDIGRELLRLV